MAKPRKPEKAVEKVVVIEVAKPPARYQELLDALGKLDTDSVEGQAKLVALMAELYTATGVTAKAVLKAQKGVVTAEQQAKKAAVAELETKLTGALAAFDTELANLGIKRVGYTPGEAVKLSGVKTGSAGNSGSHASPAIRMKEWLTEHGACVIEAGYFKGDTYQGATDIASGQAYKPQGVSAAHDRYNFITKHALKHQHTEEAEEAAEAEEAEEEDE